MDKEQRVEVIFNEAEGLYKEAMERLKERKVRDATRKAWASTIKATSALILARTGREIDGFKPLAMAFRELIKKDKEVKERLKNRFFTQQHFLSWCCTDIDSSIDSRKQVETKIKETIEYIKEVRRLAK